MYLGDQRMRRVKDQDEEGKGSRGPRDQGTKGPGDQGTKGPGDQRTRGPEDQGTRGPGDQKTRGPKDQGNLKLFSSKFICVFQVLKFFPGNFVFFPVSSLSIAFPYVSQICSIDFSRCFP